MATETLGDEVEGGGEVERGRVVVALMASGDANQEGVSMVGTSRRLLGRLLSLSPR